MNTKTTIAPLVASFLASVFCLCGEPIQRTLVIIPAARRAAANAAIASNPAFPKGRPEEFEVPLYAVSDTNQVAPTHYWLAHPFAPEQRAAVNAMTNAFPSALVFDYTDPAFPQAKLAELGLTAKTGWTP